jgi:RNA polymerase sigma-70 factor (ECF subfamily)
VATDIELVHGTLAGSERAFEELVRRYERAVVALISRMVRDPLRAPELAQDAFVKAFTRLHTFDTGRRFSTWLLAIARNVAVDELRSRARARRLVEAGVDAAAAIPDVQNAGPVELVERAEVAKVLDRAVGRLRAEYRELVILRYQHELEIDEIAAITGLPAGTVKSFLYRARQELAADLRMAGYGRARVRSYES